MAKIETKPADAEEVLVKEKLEELISFREEKSRY